MVQVIDIRYPKFPERFKAALKIQVQDYTAQIKNDVLIICQV